MSFPDGENEIGPPPARITVQQEEGLPRLVPAVALPELTDEVVRDTIEVTRP